MKSFEEHKPSNLTQPFYLLQIYVVKFPDRESKLEGRQGI